MRVGSRQQQEVITNFAHERSVSRERSFLEHLGRGKGLRPIVPLTQFEVGRVAVVISNHTAPEGLAYQTATLGQRLELGQETRLDPRIDLGHLGDASKALKMAEKWWKAEWQLAHPPLWKRIRTVLIHIRKNW